MKVVPTPPGSHVRERGLFVVIEGLDGAGKTTLADGLTAALAARGACVRQTYEPSTGPVGQLLRALLASEPLGHEAMALLFAADRVAHEEADVRPALQRGELVISTRHLLSSLAYQGPHVGLERVLELNARVAVPDLLIFLDVPPGDGLARLSAARPPDAYEQPAVARGAAAGYARGLALLEAHGWRVVRLDARRPAHEVLADALAQVLLLYR